MTLVCGPIVLDPEDEQSLTNPTVIVEVLSRSTEGYDRTEKLEHYQRLPSLEEYILVSRAERAIEVWTRGDDGSFVSRVARSGERAWLTSVGATLDVDELYQAATPPSA